VQVLKGHDDHVITCLEFCGNKIVSGSDDNTLKVWSAVNGKVPSFVTASVPFYTNYLFTTKINNLMKLLKTSFQYCLRLING